MTHTIRLAALAGALLAGTAAASAQTVYTTDPDYIAPPVAVAPAPTYVAPAYVAPAPGVVVEDEGAPVIEQRIVTPAPRVETETIVQPAPERRVIHRAPLTQVRLTTRQRHDVLRTIRVERPSRTVTERVDYRVGAALPASVPVYAMPQQVIYEAPALRGYEYTMVGDRMLVVDPASSTVVDELY
ncbi:MAG: DUF1236 domain-containing protein [Pseudolabrys sp.]